MKKQNLLRRWGFISLAERLLRESVETLEGYWKTIALGSLALIYQDRGEYEKAIEMHQQVYQIFEEMNKQGNITSPITETGHHEGDKAGRKLQL